MGFPTTKGQLRTSIADMEIGDYIRVNINPTAIASGYIVSVNEQTSYSTELPFTAIVDGANILGYMYMIKVDKGVLIGDRVPISRVSWDSLNNNKLVQGLSKTLDEVNGMIRSVTGGVAFADENGELSTTDKGFGAFPTNNEWDRYIVNFSPKLIQEEKTLNDVFHWSTVGTFSQDTPSTLVATNTNRTLRNRTSIISFSPTLSSNSNTAYGFRPVFEYKE